MGQLNKTTEKVNELLDKVDGMPSEVKDGKTPVLETGTTTTLDPGSDATSEVVANGTDDNGNPKYKLNFGIPKGYDGAGGSGGGGTADSVQWANVLNKPSWVNSATKPTYTASEVGALPASTTIPSKTSQLTNDSGFTTSASFKTVNGQSIVGSGNIVIEGGGGGDTPSAGGNVNVTNGSSLQSASYYAFKPSENGSLDGTFETIPYASSTADGLMNKEDKNKLNLMKEVSSFSVSLLGLTDSSTSEEILAAFGYGGNELMQLIILLSPMAFIEYTANDFELFIGNFRTDYYAVYDSESNTGTLQLTWVEKGALKTMTINGVSGNNSYTFSCKLSESGGSDDDTYYLPNNVYRLKVGATKEEIDDAIGDYDGLLEAVTAGKKIYIKGQYGLSYIVVPVAISTLGGVLTISFPFVGNLSSKDTRKIINRNEKSAICKIIYPEGYTLDSKVYLLTSTSTSDDISAAVGGESGLKAIIQAVNDGNRLVIRGDFGETPNILNTDVIVNIAGIDESNGNMSLSMFFGGFGTQVYLGFQFIAIGYLKSSNTFTIEVYPFQINS